MSYYYGWKPYVPVAARRKKAEQAAAKARKSGADLAPVAAYRGAIAKTFWGKAWCQNLEGYSDYANRLPRGRTYVRNGSVIDLRIDEGQVRAQVMGSSLYQVAVQVTPVAALQWQAIGKDCAGSIDSLVELLQGKLSTSVMQRICTPRTGLFPAPKEISFSCSCPDMASMCKHVAAVLYGVGARLDQQPELLFSLRRVDAKDLVSQAGASLAKPRKGPAVVKVLDNARLADVFGLEIDESAAPVIPAGAATKAAMAKSPATKVPAAKKAPGLKKAATAKKTPAATKAPAAKKAATAKKTATAKKPAAKKPAARKNSVAAKKSPARQKAW